MTGWRWLGGLALVAGLVVLIYQLPAEAGEKDTHPWKAFDKDAKPFYQTLTTKTTQLMKVNKMEVKQEQNQTFYIKWTPEKAEKDEWIVSQKIIGVKMEIDIGGNKISYDSTEANQPANPMSDFFKALTETDLKFHINITNFNSREKGKPVVTKVVGIEEFRKKLTATNPQMEQLLNKILSENALKQMAEPTWAAYPPKGVFKPKDSWPGETELDLGPIGIYTFTNKYTIDDANAFKINIKPKLTYKAPAKSEGLPFIIKSGEMTSKDEKSEGSAEYDKDKGRFKSYNLKMELAGKLTIDISGTVTLVDLEQTQVSDVKTEDEDPVEAIKKKKKG